MFRPRIQLCLHLQGPMEVYIIQKSELRNSYSCTA